ncbi:MAG: hypothetical protein K2M06_08740 [Muribaculaceae bacterium]|nr:hypothetical protein [Muribaculaceae bacterium]
MIITDLLRKYLNSRPTRFNNQVISDAILAKIKESVEDYSAGDYMEVAKYMMVSVSPEHYDRYIDVFPTAVANAVNHFLREYMYAEDFKSLETCVCCFEMNPDMSIGQSKDDDDDEDVELNVEDMVKIKYACNLPGERKYALNLIGNDGCTATIRTTRQSSGKLKRSFKGLKDPIVEGNRVWFVLSISNEEAPTSKNSGTPANEAGNALAQLSGADDNSNFLTKTNSRTKTCTMRTADLNVGGRNSAPGTPEGARIDSDRVAQHHFTLHTREGRFYLEPYSAVSINGLALITDMRPWAEIKDGDTISLPASGMNFKFSTVKE